MVSEASMQKVKDALLKFPEDEPPRLMQVKRVSGLSKQTAAKALEALRGHGEVIKEEPPQQIIWRKKQYQALRDLALKEAGRREGRPPNGGPRSLIVPLRWIVERAYTEGLGNIRRATSEAKYMLAPPLSREVMEKVERLQAKGKKLDFADIRLVEMALEYQRKQLRN